MEISLALVILLGSTALMAIARAVADTWSYPVSCLAYINAQLVYQALLLSVALLVLIVLGTMNEANFRTFVGIGRLDAPGQEVAWLGIAEGESWLSIGAGLSCVATLATSGFVHRQFRLSVAGLRQLLPHLPWVLLFSITNSFSEEVVYRLGSIVPLTGTVGTSIIMLFSAAAFGAAHLRGMPNGIVGMLLAGVLGWLLPSR